MSRLLAALIFSLTCLLPCVAQAAPGDLDTTFGGGDGWMSTSFTTYSGTSHSRQVIKQTDGKLVAAGYGWNGSNVGFALARYNSDGSLDTTFNTTGKVITSLVGSANQAHAVLQQTDGKLVAAGYSFSYTSNNYDFALVRYNSDGSLDTTFNSIGKVTTPVGTADEYAYSAIQQSDGKLVLAGKTNNGANDDFALVRYNSDGSLDTTFNLTGKVTTALGTSNDVAYSVIQQSDGKLVAAGSSRNVSNDDFALVRYNSDGSLDTTFNATGKITTALSLTADVAYSVIQQADGKLVAAGYSNNSGTNNDFALVRYNNDGSLDTTFNITGRVTTALGAATDRIYSVIQQADGKLVAAGNSASSNYDFALARYNSDGSLDATFNSTGIVKTPVGAGEDEANSVTQQADGNLVVAGYSRNAVNNNDFALVRYTNVGSLDTSFNSTGKVVTNFISSTSGINDVIQQRDGKLVAAGQSKSLHNSSDFALARYNSDGSLDTTFNGTGKVTTPVGGIDGQARSIIQQADGKLAVAGYVFKSSKYNIVLARYNSDGSLDTTFNATGMVMTTIGSMGGGYSYAYSLIQQADGKLVVAGSGANNGTNDDFALLRYNSDGSLDTTFNATGKVTTAIGTSNDMAYSVIQQTDGKLVAAGRSNNGTNDDFALVRYNSDGSLDTTFNATGKVATAVGASNDIAYSVIQQVDGKLTVVGSSLNGGYTNFALVRYNDDGSLDTTFNTTGKVTTAVGGVIDLALSMIQQVDGKLAVAGYILSGNYFDFALVRYNSDGSLDTTFNTTGKLTTDIGSLNEVANSIIQQADGKLAVAGYFNTPTGQEFLLARYESGMCFAGKYWNGSTCVEADAGNYVPNAGAISQTACAVGTYQPLTGQTTCLGVTACVEDVTYESAAPTPIVDRVCTAYSVSHCASYADTADACLSCESGYALGEANCVVDTDSDGIGDNADNCPLIANADQLNTDGDAQGNACDNDDDNDGVADDSDAFPLDASESIDTDADGVGDNSDNCPLISNTDQLDTDSDGQGDVCDVFPNDPTLLLQQDGTAKAENLGSSVAMADMNNDGVVDLLVGSPMANISRNGTVLKKAGKIQTISGKDNSVIRTINGSAANRQLGAAIAVVSDQNKDGVPDIVVGNRLADILNRSYMVFPVLKDAGRVVLYSGSDGKKLRILAEGKAAGDHFGAAVAVGDVNGDNKPDLIVGASMSDAAAKNAGRVTVFNGISKTVLYTRNGDRAGEHFGAAVAVANGHLFVGSPQFDTSTKKNAGRVSVFNSSEGRSAVLLAVDGIAKGDSFGAAITAENDDWAVGIPSTDSSGKDAGSVQLFVGLNATPVKTLAGATAGDNFGSALNMQGDVNKDGKNDIAIGAAKFDAGTTVNNKAVLLKDAGRVEVLSGAAL